MSRGRKFLETLQKQVGFCLVCGNSVNPGHSFTRSDNGVCHTGCLENKGEA